MITFVVTSFFFAIKTSIFWFLVFISLKNLDMFETILDKEFPYNDLNLLIRWL